VHTKFGRVTSRREISWESNASVIVIYIFRKQDAKLWSEMSSTTRVTVTGFRDKQTQILGCTIKKISTASYVHKILPSSLLRQMPFCEVKTIRLYLWPILWYYSVFLFLITVQLFSARKQPGGSKNKSVKAILHYVKFVIQ